MIHIVSRPISRREVLGNLLCASTAALLIPARKSETKPILIGGRPVEIIIASESSHTVRISVLPIGEASEQIQYDGSLVRKALARPRARLKTLAPVETVQLDNVLLKIDRDPLTIRVEDKGRQVQRLRIDQMSGGLSFSIGAGPVFGLGEGGPQFDRRGHVDQMRSGQGGYRLRTHGGRAPVPWLIGTSGWAMYIHQPFGTFDLTGAEGRFNPVSPAAALPLDVFIVGARDPTQVMKEYAADWLSGNAALVVLRLLAVASRSYWTRRDQVGGSHVPREEVAVRCVDLFGHRFHAFRMEHVQRRVCLASWKLS